MGYTEDTPVGETVPAESLSDTLSEPAKYRKAIMSAALTGVTAASFAAVDGFTAPEVWGIAAAVVASFVGVFGVANRQAV